MTDLPTRIFAVLERKLSPRLLCEIAEELREVPGDLAFREAVTTLGERAAARLRRPSRNVMDQV